jgi:hypothetical protein
VKPWIAVLSAAALCFAPAYAQQKAEPKQELTAQQKRMQQCNADAKKHQFKNNDERQAFMSSCLKGEAQKGAGQMTQQEKMTACNKEAGAKNLKGDARKAFMSKCLSG